MRSRFKQSAESWETTQTRDGKLGADSIQLFVERIRMAVLFSDETVNTVVSGSLHSKRIVLAQSNTFLVSLFFSSSLLKREHLFRLDHIAS